MNGWVNGMKERVNEWICKYVQKGMWGECVCVKVNGWAGKMQSTKTIITMSTNKHRCDTN